MVTHRFLIKKQWQNNWDLFSETQITGVKQTVVAGRTMTAHEASVKVLRKIGMDFYKVFDFEGHHGVIYIIKRPSRVPC